MLKQSLALMALLAMGGCATESSSPPQQAQESNQMMMQGQPESGLSAPELAAYAGSRQYPTSQPAKSDLHAAAIVDANRGVIKIYNFGSEPIRDVDVWVNRAFVRHIGGIAPGTSLTLSTGDLYNAMGQRFSSRGQHVNVVQLAHRGHLETLMGPAAE